MTGGEHSHDHDGPAPLPPTQFDSIEDGQVVRVAAEQANRYARWGTTVEVVLVFIAAAALVVLGIALLRTSAVNQVGVHRIVDCTTQGHDCYEEQQRRTTQLVATLLARLGEGHLVLECYLSVAPDARTPDTLATCKAYAAEETKRVLADLEAAAKTAEEEARKEVRKNGGKP